MKYQYLSSAEIGEKIRENPIAILPIGAVEAHGPHLPLGTDNLLAERLAEELASRTNALQLPTLPYGQVWSLKNFPGSINVRNESLINLLVDIGESVHQQGFRLFVMVNGHLGNAVALKEAARQLYQRCPGLKVLYLFYPGTKQVMEAVRETKAAHATYFHACEIETSYMLYLAPEYVDMSRAICDMPQIPALADVTPTPWEEFTKTAVLGDATLATREKGEAIIEAALAAMVKLVQEAKEGLPKE
ncbi:MAG: creatininase family protein [Brevibacillus sp.]|nr:creatininase family protein [Brevibacillus sp.]